MSDRFQLGASVAERYESHSVVFMTPFAGALLERAQLNEGDQLLDVACGTGVVARRSRATATGLDSSEDMLNVARSLAPHITWVNGSAMELPFADNTFDAVTCQQGLQFFPDATKALDEMYRVTKRIAVLSIWAPVAQNPYSRVRAEAVEKFIAAGSSAGMYSAMREDGRDFLEASVSQSRWDAFEIELVELTVNLPEVGAWSAEHILGTPQGALYEAAGSEAQNAFQAHLRAELADFARSDGTYDIPFTSWVATARV